MRGYDDPHLLHNPHHYAKGTQVKASILRYSTVAMKQRTSPSTCAQEKPAT
jgi:hypothetical protein